MKDHERDQLRKTILELLLKGGFSWTVLKKRVLGSCQPFATNGAFSRQMKYLEGEGYVKKLGEKGSRTQYEITEKGKLLLSIFDR